MNFFFFFFKQKTAYEIKECDWSSDVCSSDLKAAADYIQYEVLPAYYLTGKLPSVDLSELFIWGEAPQKNAYWRNIYKKLIGYIVIFILVAYIIFLLGFIIYSAIGIYHLWRFGYVGDLTKPVIIIYSIIAILIIILSVVLIGFKPWPIDFNL